MICGDEEVTRSLNPIPRLHIKEYLEYSAPYALVHCEQGAVVVEINERVLPRLSINSDYAAFLEQSEYRDARSYIKRINYRRQILS